MRRGGNGTQCDRNLSTPDLWECAPPIRLLGFSFSHTWMSESQLCVALGIS